MSTVASSSLLAPMSDYAPLTMTVAQVSQRYGIKQDTLRKWRQRGMRPHSFRMHGVVLYEIAEVEAFIAESNAQSGTGAA